jgi:hypothetical protein
MARHLHLSHSTVARHLARGGRHCLLFHRLLVQDFIPTEPIAFDGFESFEYSQFFPFHANLAAGHQSWFLYHFTDSPLRRKGAMTQAQKLRRTELEETFGRPDPKAVQNGVHELLKTILRPVAADASTEPPIETVDLLSDEHPAYRRAIRALREGFGKVRICHSVTPSTDPRTRANPLFPVNLADLLLRHCSANHRRETIAFSKRRQSAMERLALFTVWRNVIKPRREKLPTDTPAMSLGLLDRPLAWADVFRRRLFPRRRELPGVWWSYYWRRVRTAALGRDRKSVV